MYDQPKNEEAHQHGCAGGKRCRQELHRRQGIRADAGGRRNHQETDITCAIREWEEETGFRRESLKLIKNLCPFEEVFMGSNYKTYKHRYFLAYIKPQESPQKSYQKSEVSACTWFTLEEALQHIRSYNLEKQGLIKNIEQVLQKYRLIS